jgi:hypothetical protein
MQEPIMFFTFYGVTCTENLKFYLLGSLGFQQLSSLLAVLARGSNCTDVSGME